MKKALIIGINGQDGSYLAELLLEKGYEVFGTVRRSSFENATKLSNIVHILDRIHLLVCAIDNHLSVYRLILTVKPDECYQLAGSSFVSYSFEDELSIMSVNYNSTQYLLSSIKDLCPECRFYYAGSSEMFGNAEESPQSENSKFNPRSSYGISKLASYYFIKNYRNHYNLYACTGITYNHESVRRGYSFVTRKITSTVAKIILGLADKIELGNIDAQRDWGYAPEYVEAMHTMLNNPLGPQDYVIATGVLHSVMDFLAIAFSVVGLDYKKYLKINCDFFRPSELVPLVGNPTKIKEDLGWESKKDFQEIIKEMVLYDISLLKGER